jgi:glycosyltransferase involved in cell wall biosynthesis
MASPLLSIIITNYKYEQYVRACIESALALRYANKEIIVVDDGSPDGSPEIIRSFGESIIAILKENGGQASAANAGFARAKGQFIMFLDSDDLVEPDMMDHVLPMLKDGVVKVQYQMHLIDKDGKRLGGMFPNFSDKMTPEMTVNEFQRTGFYECSPTSGNVFARWFLEQIFPMPVGIAPGFDCFMNMAAPFYGAIVSLTNPCVRYRIHGRNSWAVDGTTRRLDAERFAFYVRDDLNRTVYATSIADKLRAPFVYTTLDFQVRHMMHRICYHRFAKNDHPITQDKVPEIAQLATMTLAHDTSLNLLYRACRAVIQSPLMTSKAKLFVCAWLYGIALLPHGMAFRLAELRFVPQSRPQFVVKLMERVGLRRVQAKTSAA